MKKNSLVVLLICTVVCFGQNQTQPNTIVSSADNQTSVSIVVYNNNIGLVRDVRQIPLPKGNGELRFKDVASSVLPATVYVKSLSKPEAFTVLEQNYEYDLMNEAKLLDKYVGKKIKIIDDNKYQDRKDVLDATLLSNNNGQIYRINNEIYLGYPGVKVVPAIPENLIAEPTLMWLYSNTEKDPHTIEVSYLTENISWKADYIFLIEKENQPANLSGWVTLNNQSGATFKNAGLKLIAGQVNRIIEQRYPEHDGFGAKMMAMPAEPGAGFEQKEFFEYHMYTLPRKTTIKNNQSKQIGLLQVSGIKAAKELLAKSSLNAFTYRMESQKEKIPVLVYMTFKNEKANNLGMPLPAGIVRVYKKDTDNSQVFLGEDQIKHTPEDEEVRLRIGEAFDVVAEKTQNDYVRLTSNIHESEWEIAVRNHKKETAKIGIVEKLEGTWTITQKSHEFKKVDAFNVRFDVEVPPAKEVKVKYRVKIGY